MKSLNEVKAELKKINEEDIDSPIFDFEKLEINYRKVNKTEKWSNDFLLEQMARDYIILHYQAKYQNEMWAKFEFPLDKNTTRKDWELRNTPRWKEYQEIQNRWNEETKKQTEYNDNLIKIWK